MQAAGLTAAGATLQYSVLANQTAIHGLPAAISQVARLLARALAPLRLAACAHGNSSRVSPCCQLATRHSVLSASLQGKPRPALFSA